MIVGEYYHLIPGTGFTVCALTLPNGHIVIGTSCPVSLANYDEGLGKQIARAQAREKIWELAGYDLRSLLKREAAMNEIDDHIAKLNPEQAHTRLLELESDAAKALAGIRADLDAIGHNVPGVEIKDYDGPARCPTCFAPSDTQAAVDNWPDRVGIETTSRMRNYTNSQPQRRDYGK